MLFYRPCACRPFWTLTPYLTQDTAFISVFCHWISLAWLCNKSHWNSIQETLRIFLCWPICGVCECGFSDCMCLPEQLPQKMLSESNHLHFHAAIIVFPFLMEIENTFPDTALEIPQQQPPSPLQFWTGDCLCLSFHLHGVKCLKILRNCSCLNVITAILPNTYFRRKT